MTDSGTFGQWILLSLVALSSFGVIFFRNPVHACLSFLLSLVCLAGLYLRLVAPFIAAMQILVYAGAILVMFMFVIVLFQDAYHNIEETPSGSYAPLLYPTAAAFFLTMIAMGRHFSSISLEKNPLPENFGTVENIGKALYIDFFFPFEIIVVIFLVAVVGALYIGKKEIV